MKTTSFIAILAMIVLSVSSCSKLRSGESFTSVSNGVEYKFEVIVSKMNYVKVYPVDSPATLTGDVEIPSTVKYDGVTYVVTQVGKNAFSNYTSIEEVNLPSTLSIIEEGAFQGCTSLEEINTPQPLSTIEAHAFDGCTSLEKFSLDASISTLGEGCFKNCSSLSDVEFPTSFTEIPNYAFYGCSSMKNLKLTSTIMKIGDGAFGQCTGLRTISMDSSVQSIGDGAFAGCSAVESIKSTTPTPPACYNSTFELVPTDTPVTVPMAHVSDYQAATGWSQFTNYQGVY